MQIERPTFEILKELEILSDTEGKYIYHLASMYIRALGFLKLTACMHAIPCYIIMSGFAVDGCFVSDKSIRS